ncbi:hypothetical protein EDC04DRAFT_2609230 [Pisolithus marmoratus]|nr:hypothetical protein EDC04DRAFT_2609230 [Pisolithus marmoratus]
MCLYNMVAMVKRSASSTLQVTSKARRLLSPNLDLKEDDDEYEPDTLTEEEEEEEDVDVDLDAPSWEVGPEAGEGIFERMTTTVSKCQPSIAPFRRHPKGVTPTSDAGIGKTGGANGDEYSHFICNICYQSFPSKSKCNPHKRRECQESGTIVDSFGVIGSVPPMEETSEEEAQNKAKGQEEEEESEEEGHNNAKGQEPYPHKIFSTTMNYYEEESKGQDHKGTTNFDQKGKRKAIIMEDDEDEDEDVNVNVDVDMDMDMDLDVDVDEDEDDEDEQEQEQEWEQEHEWEQEQEQEQEEPPSGFLYHPYLDTINLKVNWEFRFLICEVCKEAIKKQDVIGHVKTHKLKVDPSQLAKATDQLKYLGIYIYSLCTNHTVTIFVQMDYQ